MSNLEQALTQDNPTPATFQKPFLTSYEAAAYLGIAQITLYTYTCNRVIPFYKTKRKLYFKIVDLDNYVLNNDNRIKSAEEIEKEAKRYEATKKF
jgi:excisionase family DNA binding protein